MECVAVRQDHGLYVSVNAEDASRADLEFLVQFGQTAKEAGADRVRFCDTLGILTPSTRTTRSRSSWKKVGIDIEMHTHDDFGMATANAIAGVKAGATYVNTTVMVSARGPAMPPSRRSSWRSSTSGQVDMGLHTNRFREISEYVATASASTIPAWKPIVGTNSSPTRAASTPTAS